MFRCCFFFVTIDIIGRLGVYVLDGNEELKHLLGFLITKETFSNNVIVLVVDMARPWFAMQALTRWSTILEEHINDLNLGDELTALKEKRAISIVLSFFCLFIPLWGSLLSCAFYQS